MKQRPVILVAQAILPAQVFADSCSKRGQDSSGKKREMKNRGLRYIQPECSHV